MGQNLYKIEYVPTDIDHMSLDQIFFMQRFLDDQGTYTMDMDQLGEKLLDMEDDNEVRTPDVTKLIKCLIKELKVDEVISFAIN